MKHFDATLEEAADLRRTPRLPRGLAITIAVIVGLLLVAYGVLACARMQPSAGKTKPAPPAGDHAR